MDLNYFNGTVADLYAYANIPSLFLSTRKKLPVSMNWTACRNTLTSEEWRLGPSD